MRGFDDAAALAEGGACLGRVVAPRAVVEDESLFLPKREALPEVEEGAGTTKPWTSTAPSRRSRAAKAPPCVLDLVAMFAVWCAGGLGRGESVRRRTRRWCCCRARACGVWPVVLGRAIWAACGRGGGMKKPCENSDVEQEQKLCFDEGGLGAGKIGGGEQRGG